MLWSTDGKAWDTGDGWEFCTSPRMTERTRYLGPCLTPAEVAAREQAAAVKMREACAAIVANVYPVTHGATREWRKARDAVAALSASNDALDAMLAQAKREGMEEAARLVDETGFRPSGYATQQALAAAIRARAKEIRP